MFSHAELDRQGVFLLALKKSGFQRTPPTMKSNGTKESIFHTPREFYEDLEHSGIQMNQERRSDRNEITCQPSCWYHLPGTDIAKLETNEMSPV